MSAFNSYDNVERHLGLLAKQSFIAFDVLLVLGVPFDALRLEKWLAGRKFPFGVIVSQENERRGCSGGFFTGQKFALEHGYDYVIMADDDCMPVDRHLLESLWKNRSREYVVPKTVFVADGYRKPGFSAGPTQYSLYSAEVFRKYGLYYLPLFHGADDGEYMERVKVKPFQIENKTEHPYIAGMRLFSGFDRSLLFLHQALVIMKNRRALLYNLAQHAFLATASLFFLPAYGRRAFSRMERLLFSYTYGKAASEGMRSGFEAFVEQRGRGSFVGFSIVDERDASYIEKSSGGKAAGLLAQACSFRKDVVVENTYSFVRGFALAAMARRLYVKVGGGKYLWMADNRSALPHAIKLALFLPALALVFALSLFIFVPIKFACQPKTYGYGLD